ncbi:hypothetical protein M0802_012145 [Mischocyttarus mexicanus]|nr:hypothetical protein M0802_012145 [Mischocyttarus mexicanus]
MDMDMQHWILEQSVGASNVHLLKRISICILQGGGCGGLGGGRESHGGEHEKRLLNNLLSNYNTLERPVANESEPLEVKFGITLQQIIDVVRQLIY